MTSELVVGGDGFIGRHLCKHRPNAMRTTRRAVERYDPGGEIYHFDMLDPKPPPDVDTVYICAGVNGTLECSRAPQRSYRTNVDGTIWLAEHYRARAFVVWVSSTTVEWLDEHYGRQKRIAESHLRMLPHVGIVRAGRVLQSNVDSLCDLMITIGRERRPGIVLWGEDERPYQH